MATDCDARVFQFKETVKEVYDTAVRTHNQSELKCSNGAMFHFSLDSPLDPYDMIAYKVITNGEPHYFVRDYLFI